MNRSMHAKNAYRLGIMLRSEHAPEKLPAFALQAGRFWL